MDNLEDDIPLDLARSAYTGISFDPEKRAEQERQSYAATLRTDYANLRVYVARASAEVQEARKAVLDTEMVRYREGYRDRYLRYLATKSRIVSVMIAGPSKYPTARMEKRNRIADARLQDLVTYRERALAAIRRELTPEDRPILSGDSDAIARLEKEIASAEQKQELMRNANAAIRKHKSLPQTGKAGSNKGLNTSRLGESQAQARDCEVKAAQTAALAELGIPGRLCIELLKPDFAGRIGFPDYELTNNGANIRRLQGRLTAIKVAKATPETSKENQETGVKIEDCPAENRIRIFFPGKPELAVRDRLKSAAFRWAPSLGCWPSTRHHNALQLAQSLA